MKTENFINKLLGLKAPKDEWDKKFPMYSYNQLISLIQDYNDFMPQIGERVYAWNYKGSVYSGIYSGKVIVDNIRLFAVTDDTGKKYNWENVSRIHPELIGAYDYPD